ncbi:TATA box-binding protein-associated factor RNA polymerase I subunit A [Boleophthalmus pectinirostris]|uniref:TATA box-binding protein-associated factor RNA polymerase I subunit A n=1 Tax=Boleophthalmus pectinirostris TaxID=150288 RepID=UPI000A1C5866|nr:TATA box-binding protein-associated factor RNA polymerase I subunit A [Boleophthalmus pectinirostris]
MDDIYNELQRLEPEPESDSFSVDSTASTKKAKLPLPKSTSLKKKHETGFHESTRLCLEQIREAMLHHRWEEAAEYMAYFQQILEDNTHNREVQHKELIWRMGIEILHHHPNSKLEDYNNIYDRIKHSGVKQYLKVCLEQSFHLLLLGHLQEAKNTLSVAETWRYGKETTAQIKRTTLIKAYRSLLDYFIWCEKKAGTSTKDFAQNAATQSMHIYFRQASVNLKEIFKNPGVWDPFILSYVEMLEFYDDQEEALRVLEEYAYDNSFPPNPNAHVYLYQYLKRHDATTKKLLKVLKILHALVPSHSLMTEYCSLLLESGKTRKALEVTVDMLDYACWRNNLEIWKTLKSIIEKLQSEEDFEDTVSEVMFGRMDWWPALHFTIFHAAQDQRENPELRRVKAPLAKVLCPGLTLRYCDMEEATREIQTTQRKFTRISVTNSR